MYNFLKKAELIVTELSVMVVKRLGVREEKRYWLKEIRWLFLLLDGKFWKDVMYNTMITVNNNVLNTGNLLRAYLNTHTHTKGKYVW